MTPFENFFAGRYQAALDAIGDEAVFSAPNITIKGASWDRKAAYLLWVALGRPGDLATQPFDAPEPETVLTACAVCGKPQFDTPSGITCENGHGGAAAEDDWDIA